MKHSLKASLNQIVIQPLRQEDLESLRNWRNDQVLSKYLRHIDYISPEQQNKWYREYLKEKDTYFWAIYESGKVIGALSVYNVLDTKAEIGRIMIGNSEARGKGYGYLALISAMKIGFNLLGLKSFYLDVHEKNIAAIKTYEKAGFKIVDSHSYDEEGNEYRMEIDEVTFEKTNMLHSKVDVSWEL